MQSGEYPGAEAIPYPEPTPPKDAAPQSNLHPPGYAERRKPLECPVTQQLFLVPVLIGCGGGHTFEEDVAKKCGDRCPTCRNEFKRYDINRALLDSVEAYIRDYGDKDRYVQGILNKLQK